MKILLCIDDTDNLESKGTGAIATEIKDIIEKNDWGKCGYTTRHQLLIHEDVPYTSHNSSMCFDADIKEKFYNDILETSSKYLETESAEGSDPGICIVIKDDIKDIQKLIDFGLKAKRRVLIKKEAYDLAKELDVYLDEKGGDGQGVVGALAGIGLRLSGNDGELKGGVKELKQDRKYEVSYLLNYSHIDKVCNIYNMKMLSEDEIVKIGWKAKPILKDGKLILIVRKEEDNEWVTLDKKAIRHYGDERIYKIACEHFIPDVDEEKVTKDTKSCLNCRYRRWTKDSFVCVYEK